MKNSICKCLLCLLIAAFSYHCQAGEETLKNLRNLGSEEEKMRIKMLENPTPENMAKHKETAKELFKG